MNTYTATTTTTNKIRQDRKAQFTCPDCGWFCVLWAKSNDSHEHQSCNGDLFGKHHPDDDVS